MSNTVQSRGINFIEGFEKLDANRDGLLTLDELDRAVLDPDLDDDLAEVVVILKVLFRTIREFVKNDTDRKDAITGADVRVLDQLWSEFSCKLAALEFYESSSQRSKILTNPVEISRRIAALSYNFQYLREQNPALYKDETAPLLSIRSEAIAQGFVGNCALLAALGSLAAVHPLTILKMISVENEHSYKVTFPGDRSNPIIVAKPTRAELAMGCTPTEYGIWPNVIVKAFGINQRQCSFNPRKIDEENTEAQSRYWIEIYGLLTGQRGSLLYLPSQMLHRIVETLSKARREKRLMTAWSKSSCSRIPGSHAFSIIDWDGTFVRLRNPWGAVDDSEPMNGDGQAQDGCLDGIFSLDIHDFIDSCDYLHFEEWGQDDQVVGSDQKSQEEKVESCAASGPGLRPALSRVGGWTITLVGVVTLLLCYLLVCRGQEVMSWPATTGTVIEIKEQMRDASLYPANGSDLLRAVVYKVGNRKYQSENLGGMELLLAGDNALVSLANLSPGTRVPVYYNPRDPNEACLRQGISWEKIDLLAPYIFVGFLVSVLGLAILICGDVFAECPDEKRRREGLSEDDDES